MSLHNLIEKLRKLEKVAVFRTFSYVTGVVAIILIIIGLFIPAWIVFEMKISTVGMRNAALNAQRTFAHQRSSNLPSSETTAKKMDLLSNNMNQQQQQHDQQGLTANQGATKPLENSHPSSQSMAPNNDFDPDMDTSRGPTLNLDMRHVVIRTAAHIGLWHVSACIDTGDVRVGEHCVTMAMSKFASSLTGGSTMVTVHGLHVFFGHFEAMQVLMITGCVFAIVGLVLLFFYHRREDSFGSVKTNLGILCCVFWGLAALMIFGAVAAEGHQNSNIYNNINMMKAVNPATEHFDMNVHFPWSLLIACLGAVFCVIVKLTLAIWMCKVPMVTEKKNPGDWHEFSNNPQTA